MTCTQRESTTSSAALDSDLTVFGRHKHKQKQMHAARQPTFPMFLNPAAGLGAFYFNLQVPRDDFLAIRRRPAWPKCRLKVRTPSRPDWVLSVSLKRLHLKA